MLHDVEAPVDVHRVLQREGNPSAKHAGAHRRDRAVEHAQKALPLVAEALEQLQVADGEFVEAHIAVLLYAAQACDVARVGVVCKVKVVEYGSGGHHCQRYAGDAETLERGGLELLEQAVAGGLGGEHPVLQLEGQVAAVEAVEPLAAATLHQHLLGGEVAQQFVNVVNGALRGHELAGGDVEQRHPHLRLAREVESGQEIVLAVRQYIVAQRHAGGHQLGDAAAHHAVLHRLGVLELLADGHALAGAYQAGQVGVEGMVRKPGQLHRRGGAVGAARERYAENLGGRDGIVGEGLVEVAHTEKEHRVGVLPFHLEILLHQGSLNNLFCHGLGIFID